MTLVATNVAARGLDINDVQLIIQVLLMNVHTMYQIILFFCHNLVCWYLYFVSVWTPTRCRSLYPSFWTHRKSRYFYRICYWLTMGLWYWSYRFKVILWFCFYSGNTGVAVMLYDPKRSNIPRIERESGVKFEHVSAPQPDDIAKAVSGEAAEMIIQVSDRYACYLLIVLKCLMLSFAVNIYHHKNVVWFLHSSLLLKSFWTVLVYQSLNYWQRLLPRLLWVNVLPRFLHLFFLAKFLLNILNPHLLFF